MLEILIAEAAPLIFLATSDSLDLLTKPAIPVLVPDIIYVDAIRLAPLGSIVPWALANGSLVTLKPTEASSLREASAIVREIIADKPSDRIILLFNDSELPRSENVVQITVSGYTQAAREMQSVDDLWDLVQRYAAPV